MNPNQVALNRSVRLALEAATPVYTSTRESEQAKLLSRAEALACTDEFCFICSRATDHFAEHSDAQILAWAAKPGLVQSLLED